MSCAGSCSLVRRRPERAHVPPSLRPRPAPASSHPPDDRATSNGLERMNKSKCASMDTINNVQSQALSPLSLQSNVSCRFRTKGARHGVHCAQDGAAEHGATDIHSIAVRKENKYRDTFDHNSKKKTNIDILCIAARIEAAVKLVELRL